MNTCESTEWSLWVAKWIDSLLCPNCSLILNRVGNLIVSMSTCYVLEKEWVWYQKWLQDLYHVYVLSYCRFAKIPRIFQDALWRTSRQDMKLVGYLFFVGWCSRAYQCWNCGDTLGQSEGILYCTVETVVDCWDVWGIGVNPVVRWKCTPWPYYQFWNWLLNSMSKCTVNCVSSNRIINRIVSCKWWAGLYTHWILLATSYNILKICVANILSLANKHTTLFCYPQLCNSTKMVHKNPTLWHFLEIHSLKQMGGGPS